MFLNWVSTYAFNFHFDFQFASSQHFSKPFKILCFEMIWWQLYKLINRFTKLKVNLTISTRYLIMWWCRTIYLVWPWIPYFFHCSLGISSINYSRNHSLFLLYLCILVWIILLDMLLNFLWFIYPLHSRGNSWLFL